ncbi:MAG: hypothetical protein LBQ75_07520 [Zoogloeaceae bacterium]|nr:hypothetical protein [Zoogloeaceae bacterium]
MHKTFWLLLLFVVAFMQPVYADAAQPCDGETIQAVAAWAGVKGKLVSAYKDPPGGLIAAAACKKMPNAPGTTIAAIAFVERVEDDGYGHDSRTLLEVIALVESGKVVAAHRATIEEDAITQVYENSYRIDTARYILSKEVRAFGVVFMSGAASGSRCADAGYGSDLTLWIREGENLRAVFETNLNGWVSLDGTCEDIKETRSEYAEMTISIEKTSSHGFADLAITAHVKRILCVKDSSRYSSYECPDTKKRTVRTVVKYDGKSYGINMSRTFWWPQEVHQKWKTESE